MDYQFENLGDERFQEFCSTLIAKEFPDSQSYPVGQPDGGRDAIAYLMDSNKKDFYVFQVKYVRDPNSIKDTYRWLSDVINKEAPKVDELTTRGAKRYYLLTNLKGTAHLDNGSKDKINKILEDKISISSLCWWRDDLCRLVEKDSIFRWSFPELINGQDVLNSLVFQGINESKERRESIVKAYLADQYSIDNEVKFRQIDLQNKLLDLYTDVPIRIKKLNEKDRLLKKMLDLFERSYRRSFYNEDLSHFDEIENVGAASFLLHPKVQSQLERVLLEGGPGQGKSTISQFICQVHRARLLNKESDVQLIPEHMRVTPIRLPFKIDLRHVAMWVENKNPYQSRLNEEQFKSISRNSLESFLIGHVLYHSQSDSFNSDDLNVILKNSSALFVFDGFDEIADLKIRKEVIEFINKGINRIKENSKSIQIVVTSRPAAFSDTIGFSVDEYPHFQLTDITTKTTKEYVEKWIKASKLDSRESAEIRRLVEEKLQLPHLKDLAKSPMQLAIFISLLRTRGESLPNKRTALYDSYIELFFNRESEKNYTIRDHRDLIIDIHQYLAWILHSEAELLGNSGSIGIDELKQRLKQYLIKEGHKTDIADNLFHVLQERVCALVSGYKGLMNLKYSP
ncbi:NACHT domain-containing protein [Emticicia sp. CRIBPO]|uniref:NACHT domain-containing protein n=1 Tax=Emticicia sp. CRIBPO TaxID=2683258 RepID=UPI00141319FB|nr:NACHT domain-containing protein [Emticicia sp. CRIBPO]NBA84629.1 NACHT domain-containing protein [Emticicia sp. CRIBPO]